MFADWSRSRVIRALMDGRALPASRLAAEAGVSGATTSAHLAKLLDAGFVEVEQSGRHRFYSLAGPEVADAFEALSQLGSVEPVRSLREGTRAERLRAARTCYDHLAGRLGVRVTRCSTEGCWCATTGRRTCAAGSRTPARHPSGTIPYALGDDADRSLADWDVDLAEVEGDQRPSLGFCMDWTEQQHHLAGGLGAAVLTAFRHNGWVAPGLRSRELAVTDAGAAALGG